MSRKYTKKFEAKRRMTQTILFNSGIFNIKKIAELSEIDRKSAKEHIKEVQSIIRKYFNIGFVNKEKGRKCTRKTKRNQN